MSLVSVGNCLRRQALASYAGTSYRCYASTSQPGPTPPPPSIDSTPSEDARERMNDASSSNNTHFGFRDVLEDEKIGLGESRCKNKRKKEAA